MSDSSNDTTTLGTIKPAPEEVKPDSEISASVLLSDDQRKFDELQKD